MKLKFSSALFAAVSNSAKQQIVKAFGSAPGFPKDDAVIDFMLAEFDKCVPPNAKNPKDYLIWITKNAFNGGVGFHPDEMLKSFQNNGTPGPDVWFEDFHGLKDILTSYAAMCAPGGGLVGPDQNFSNYNQMADLAEKLDAINPQANKKKSEITLHNLPEECDPSATGNAGPPGHPKAEFAAAATLVASANGWECYRFEQEGPGTGPSRSALSWGCYFPWFGTNWCVNRAYGQQLWKSIGYLTDGPFYILARGGKTQYAIEYGGGRPKLVNHANQTTPIATGSQSGGDFPSLKGTADKMGVELGFDAISTIPQEIIPIILAASQSDQHLGKTIPQAQLKPMDTSKLDAVIAKTPAAALVQDLNANSHSAGRTTVKAILARCTQRNRFKGFDGVWDQFKEPLMIEYIEALAANGHKELPPSLEAYFVKEAENFEF